MAGKHCKRHSNLHLQLPLLQKIQRKDQRKGKDFLQRSAGLHPPQRTKMHERAGSHPSLMVCVVFLVDNDPTEDHNNFINTTERHVDKLWSMKCCNNIKIRGVKTSVNSDVAANHFMNNVSCHTERHFDSVRIVKPAVASQMQTNEQVSSHGHVSQKQNKSHQSNGTQCRRFCCFESTSSDCEHVSLDISIVFVIIIAIVIACCVLDLACPDGKHSGRHADAPGNEKLLHSCLRVCQREHNFEATETNTEQEKAGKFKMLGVQ